MINRPVNNGRQEVRKEGRIVTENRNRLRMGPWGRQMREKRSSNATVEEDSSHKVMIINGIKRFLKSL